MGVLFNAFGQVSIYTISTSNDVFNMPMSSSERAIFGTFSNLAQFWQNYEEEEKEGKKPTECGITFLTLPHWLCFTFLEMTRHTQRERKRDHIQFLILLNFFHEISKFRVAAQNSRIEIGGGGKMLFPPFIYVFIAIPSSDALNMYCIQISTP